MHLCTSDTAAGGTETGPRHGGMKGGLSRCVSCKLSRDQISDSELQNVGIKHLQTNFIGQGVKVLN